MIIFVVFTMLLWQNESGSNCRFELQPSLATTHTDDMRATTQLVPCEKPNNKNFRDLAGLRFGKLSVLSHVGKNLDGKLFWRCLCECGEESIVNGGSLTSGKAKSCGCMIGRSVKHGLHSVPEYRVWGAVKDRCHNPKHKGYKDYGGRGIEVCDEWRNSFANFYRDMGSRPHPKLTIERLNNNLGYYKENCIWGTRSRQARNKRTTIWVEFGGKRMCLADCAVLAGVKYDHLHHWVRNRGATLDDAISAVRKHAEVRG